MDIFRGRECLRNVLISRFTPISDSHALRVSRCILPNVLLNEITSSVVVCSRFGSKEIDEGPNRWIMKTFVERSSRKRYLVVVSHESVSFDRRVIIIGVGCNVASLPRVPKFSRKGVGGAKPRSSYRRICPGKWAQNLWSGLHAPGNHYLHQGARIFIRTTLPAPHTLSLSTHVRKITEVHVSLYVFVTLTLSSLSKNFLGKISLLNEHVYRLTCSFSACHPHRTNG